MNTYLICYSCSAVYYAISVSYIYCCFLTPKDKIKYPFYTCILIMLPMVLQTIATGVLITFSVSACMFLALFIFKDSWARRLAGFITAYLVQLTGEFISVTLSYVVSYFIWGEALPLRVSSASTPQKLALTVVLIIMTGIPLLSMIGPLLREGFRYIRTRTFAMLGLPIIISMFVYNLLLLQMNSAHFALYQGFSCIICLICYLPLTIGFRDMHRQELKRHTQESQKVLIKRQLDYSQQMEGEYNALRKWNHDIDNHFLSLSYLLESENYEECKSYLETLLDTENSSEI